ncbi:MAG: saccharopine dehydrogenase NADP-binding domain-containing protein [Bacteroidia bacterium]|nr:saccharopine dehydrogenase NADP-binding domain-containing protein [Bacteroidia bacterium]
MDAANFLIYGSTGYTGQLIAQKAVELGLKPILAGRNPDKVRAQAEALGLEWRAFSVTDSLALEEALSGVEAVLHCAGPFAHTYQAMAAACLNTRTHYLDITGEIEVFEGLKGLDTKARAAGVMLLPGAGFDVVPTDCMAARLKEVMPSATHLELAFLSLGGGMSHGTAKTMVEGLQTGAMIRREGKLVQLPAASLTRKIDFGRGPVTMSAIPWGDVSTAFHSTGIPNIIAYTYLSGGMRFFSTVGRPFWGIFKSQAVQEFLKKQIEKRPAGPSEEALKTGKTLIWGEVRNGVGESFSGRLKTSQGYEFTADAALILVEKVVSGNAKPGFQTPSSAYGWQVVDEVPGSEWSGF